MPRPQAELEPEPDASEPRQTAARPWDLSITETGLWAYHVLGLPPDTLSSSKLRTEFQCDGVDGDDMFRSTSKRLRKRR